MRILPAFETALFVATAVVSTNAPGYIKTDVGLKAFATDGPAPEVAIGAPEGSRYRFWATSTANSSCPTAQKNRRSARASNA